MVLNADEPRRAPDIVQAEGETSLLIPADDSKEARGARRPAHLYPKSRCPSCWPSNLLSPSIARVQAVSATAEIARRLREWNPFRESALLDLVLALRGVQQRAFASLADMP